MAGERVRAFVPAPLRAAPRLVLDGTLQKHLEQATLALGRLDGVSLSCLIARSSYYVCEKGGALVSARTTSSRSSTVSADAGRVPRPRQRQAAGEFRKSQNWIGGTRPGNAIFVPPPHTALESAMSDLERFLHVDDDGLPLLARAGIAHVQFETIHPFLDGNGRVGRLLITLLFCSAGVLREPLLYLSLYLKKHHTKYYELLDGVRRDGDWEAWLSFFFDGVRETSASAVTSAHAMSEL